MTVFVKDRISQIIQEKLIDSGETEFPQLTRREADGRLIAGCGKELRPLFRSWENEQAWGD